MDTKKKNRTNEYVQIMIKKKNQITRVDKKNKKNKDIKKNSFQVISKDFIKNDFKLMNSIYLFTK